MKKPVYKDFQHVLITRFSVRMSIETAFQGRSAGWLFNIERLNQKLALFEHVTLASILAGSARPDSYLILIDPLLPDEILARLKSIISPHSWIHLKVINPGDITKMQTISGFGNSIEKHHRYILTTNLDDDDALGIDYLKNLQSTISEGITTNRFGRLHWFGSIDMQEWDILLGTGAPLGFLKPYSGNVMFTLSTGYSVLTRNHKVAPTIFTLSHSRCLDYLTTRHRRGNFDIGARRRFALKFFARSALMGAWKEIMKFIFGIPLATRLDTDTPEKFEGLIINHGDNLQKGRLDQGKSQRVPLSRGILEKRFGVQSTKYVQQVK